LGKICYYAEPLQLAVSVEIISCMLIIASISLTTFNSNREEEREMHPYCMDASIRTLPWSPLAGGKVLGKGRDTPREKMQHKDCTEEESAIIDRVSKLATKKGVSTAEVGLAWVLSKDVVSSPIIGPRKMSHLEDAIKALELKLSDEDVKYLEEPYKPRVPAGHT
jgi:aryl-alcohol dehydrogenase-like predicted oxidoreductase